MAFSATVVEVIDLGNGLILEVGTWDSDSVTTGTITGVDGSTDYGLGDTALTKVLLSDFSSDGDNAVAKAYDVAPNKVKITTTSSDTGTYRLLGYAR
jgi:hypothetical protein